jgi:pentatricopeptide repeat protein
MRHHGSVPRTVVAALMLVSISGFAPPRADLRRSAAFHRVQPRAVTTVDEVDAMSYRELQAECKALGLKAAGSKGVLRDRLVESLGGTAGTGAGAGSAAAAVGGGGGGVSAVAEDGGSEGFWSPTSTKLLLESLGAVQVVKQTGPMGKYILGKLSGSDILDALKKDITSAGSAGSAESCALLSSLDPDAHVQFGFVNKVGAHPIKVVLGNSGPTAAITVEIVDGGEPTSGEPEAGGAPSLGSVADELEDILSIGDGFAASSGRSDDSGGSEMSLDDLGVGGVDDFWDSMGISSATGAREGDDLSTDEDVLSALRELDAIDDSLSSAPQRSTAPGGGGGGGGGISSLLSSVFEDEGVSATPEERAADVSSAKADLIDAHERGYYHSVARAYKRWARAAGPEEKRTEGAIQSPLGSNDDDEGGGGDGSSPRAEEAATAAVSDVDSDSVSVFALMLRSCQRGRLGDDAEMALRDLLEARAAAGGKLSIKELNMVLSAHARGGAADQALGLLKSARTLYDLTPDVISFTTVIHGLTAAGDDANHGAALRLVDEMRADPSIGAEEDLTVLRLTINAASRMGNWRRAQQELAKARRRPQGERMWDMASLYTSVMAALNVAQEYERLLDVFNMMEEDGVDPNGTGYGLAICAAARLGWDRSKLQVRLQPSPAAPFPV